MINLLPVSEQHLDKLLALAKITFTEAFKDQNNPENFKLHMDQAFNNQAFTEQLGDHDAHFYFITASGKTVGYIKINEKQAQNEQFDASSIELERFYIKSAFQGQHIGEKVLKKVVKLAKNKGVAFLWLGVWEKNYQAIRFYERHGFKKFGSHPYYLGNEEQTDYLMKIDLIPPPL